LPGVLTLTNKLEERSGESADAVAERKSGGSTGVEMEVGAGSVVEAAAFPKFDDGGSDWSGSWSEQVEEAEAVAAASRGVGFGPAVVAAGVPSLGEAVVAESVSSVGSGVVVDRGAGVGAVSREVREAVVFGGVADDYPTAVGSVAPAVGGGFYSTIVRGVRAKALRSLLKKLLGEALPKHAAVDLAICTYSAGVMPDELPYGKKRLGALASLGDAVMTMHVVAAEVGLGHDTASVQSVRSRVASNVALVSACERVGLMPLVAFAPGVDCRTAKPAATALEAVVGVLALYSRPGVVKSFLTAAGVL